MTKNSDITKQYRGDFALNLLNKAQKSIKYSFFKSSIKMNPQDLIIRAALVTLLMFMLQTAHTMFGSTGTTMVAGLFLLAMLTPFLFQGVARREQKEENDPDSNSYFLQQQEQDV